MSVCFKYDLIGETNRQGDQEPKKKAAEIIARLDVGGDKKLNKYEFISGFVEENILEHQINAFFL